MNTNDIVKKFEKEVCPCCTHYKDKNYKGCSVVVMINGKANCINCKCIDYNRKQE